MENDIIKIARKAVDIEADALDHLEEYIDENFEKAINLLNKIKGKIIVSGVGKSGQIGAKIASSMASAGTPSFFINPLEAAHGDLGMITKDDAVIAISNGGNTKELIVIYEYCKRFGIPIVGLTSGKDSLLAKNSDALLLIPETIEACPIGRVPTTSSLVTLAMGDAVTVALAHLKGLTEEVYKYWHPHGSIGASLKKVSELMHNIEELPIVNMNDTTRKALDALRNEDRKLRFGCVGAIDAKGKLVGILTEGDFAHILKKAKSLNFLDEPVSKVMKENPKYVNANQLASEAMHIMDEYNIKVLFVLDENLKPVGLIQLYDLMEAGLI